MSPRLRHTLVLACPMSVALVWACATGPALTVLRSEPGSKPEPVVGDTVRVTRPTMADYSGMKPGYFAVRTIEQWRGIWEGGERPLPSSMELGRKMIYAASSDSPDVVRMRVHRVIDTANTLHVYTKETRLGKDCIRKDKDRGAFDFVVSDLIDKPVRVYVEVEDQPSCGAPPTADVSCRVGQAAEWSRKVSARPGDTVDCEARLDAKGVFPIVDRTWQFAEVPGGSSTKMTFAKDGLKVSFDPDLFGEYKVSFEVIDEGMRRGVSVVSCEVLPPNDRDVFVQLVWAGYDATDDPTTFPRIQLRASDDPKSPKRSGRECSLTSAAKPEWCDISTKGPATHLHVKGSAPGRYVMSVHYTDERVDGSPYLCLRTFVGGKRAFEQCDKTKRDADAEWAIGFLDGATGTFDDGTPKVVLDGGAEGGATEGGPPPPPATTADPAGLAKKRRQE